MSVSLKDFLEAFVAEHSFTSGDGLILDVSPEEVEALGDFLVRGLCGWMLSIVVERRSWQPGSRPDEIVPPAMPARQDIGDVTDGHRDLVHSSDFRKE
jgi:hypothetical protein